MRWWLLQLLVCVVAQIVVCFGFDARPIPQIRRQQQCVALLLAKDDDGAASINRSNSVPAVIEMLGYEYENLESNAAALRRLTDLVTRYRHLELSNEERTMAKQHIGVLLDSLLEAVNSDDSIDLNPNALADVLTALPKVTYERKLPLAARVCSLLNESNQDVVKHLKPHRLVECLEALEALDLYDSDLIGRFCHRLMKGDALAALQPRHYARGLKAMANLQHENDNVVPTAMQAFMRRWRKQAVRQAATNADICQALYATRLLKQQKDNECDGETTTMVYTLFRELHCPSPNSTISRSLTAGQVAEVLLTASAFQVNASNPIINHVMDSLEHEGTLQRATVPDIARILFSMERLHLSQYPLVVQGMGSQFQNLVQQKAATMEPKSVCNILRCALRLHQHDEGVMGPFVNATCTLIVSRPNNGFLQSCSDMELASLVRFLCLARCTDGDALQSLSDRILQPAMVESCSPRAASQILTYFTLWNDVSERELPLSQLFHELGTHLLSTQLSAAETSASMQAYAKASYVQDMGIFDHLASHLTTLLEDCSVRNVVQALWACGKLKLWEANDLEEKDEPPYLEAAREYAAFLSSNTSKLNSKDVSQALWAMGRLEIDDKSIVDSLALRARQVASECNSAEVANVLWGLSRLGYNDREEVSVLTDHMMELQPSPQEAAMVLYAFGRMDIRDEAVFAFMSNAMMEQLESASAQAIANALWAYRTVEISPPRELMDRWVMEKLDGVRVNGMEYY